MTYTTPNGIRYPNDPSVYADLIKFFREMAEDVDTKFIPKSGNQAVSGALTSKYLVSTNGGTTQSATVLQTGSNAGSAFTFYDDNVRIDGVAGRRLWIAGANGTDVAIRTRNSGETLNRIDMRASNVYIKGAVYVDGTLNVTGIRTVNPRWETNQTLVKQKTTWQPLPAAPGFTFVAPPSGQVTIGFGAMLPTSATTAQLTYRVRLGAALGSGTTIMDVNPAGWNPLTQPPPHSVATNGVTSGGVQYSAAYTAFVLGTGTTSSQLVGLAAGQTYNVVPYYINQNTIDLTLFRVYFVVTPDL